MFASKPDCLELVLSKVSFFTQKSSLIRIFDFLSLVTWSHRHRPLSIFAVRSSMFFKHDVGIVVSLWELWLKLPICHVRCRGQPDSRLEISTDRQIFNRAIGKHLGLFQRSNAWACTSNQYLTFVINQVHCIKWIEAIVNCWRSNDANL